MNAKQAETLATIKRRMVERASTTNIKYEVKQEDLTDLGHVVSVAVSIGLVNETESARAFLRDYRHFFIGQRGGVELVSVDWLNRFESLNGRRVKGIDNAIRYLPKAV